MSDRIHAEGGNKDGGHRPRIEPDIWRGIFPRPAFPIATAGSLGASSLSRNRVFDQIGASESLVRVSGCAPRGCALRYGIFRHRGLDGKALSWRRRRGLANLATI
jgi:hypothetical protein